MSRPIFITGRVLMSLEWCLEHTNTRPETNRICKSTTDRTNRTKTNSTKPNRPNSTRPEPNRNRSGCVRVAYSGDHRSGWAAQHVCGLLPDQSRQKVRPPPRPSARPPARPHARPIPIPAPARLKPASLLFVSSVGHTSRQKAQLILPVHQRASQPAAQFVLPVRLLSAPCCVSYPTSNGPANETGRWFRCRDSKVAYRSLKIISFELHANSDKLALLLLSLL